MPLSMILTIKLRGALAFFLQLLENSNSQIKRQFNPMTNQISLLV